MSLFPCAEQASAPSANRRGLTLLELIVALGILAVLSTIAVTSLDPLANQARYESTKRLLDHLRIAAVGDPALRQINGQRILSGYIADTGLLPSSLADLTTQPVGTVAHSIQSFDSDRDGVDDVILSSGWRGPYLHFGPGQNSLLDGWGRAPTINVVAGDLEILSLGADNDSTAPEDDYNADLSVTIRSVDYASNVVFRLFEIDGSGNRINPAPGGLDQLGILLYCVNGNSGTTGAIEETLLPVAAEGSFEVSRPNIVHGTAAARGILWRDNNGNEVLDAFENILLSSYVHYFTVIGGADARIEMELR